MSALDEVVAEDGTIFRRGKAVCEAADARAELCGLREERDALRERLADVELIAREACAGRVLQRFDGRVWTFAFRSNRLQFTECSFHDDGTGLPILTPEARARLRGEAAP